MSCMVERLPNNCARLLDNFEKTFGDKARLGVGVLCTKGGKNRFYLKVDLGATGTGMSAALHIYKVKCAYDDITVPTIGDMFSKIYPDFLLKPTPFMPIDRLVSDFKLDKEQLAAAILKGIRGKMKKNLSTWGGKNGICVYAQKNAYYNTESFSSGEMPHFKSFSEFLVWVDLNVK